MWHLWETGEIHTGLVGKRLLERSTHRCEDNNGMDLQEVEWGGMDWIDLA